MLPVKTTKTYRNNAREEKNLTILELLKKGNYNKVLLKEYSGWGGLKNSINDINVKNRLEQLLSKQEIEILSKTFRNAHYTPKHLVDFVYAGIMEYNPKIVNILEPSVGVGAFIEHMPNSLRKNSKIVAIDLDGVAIQIAKTLYPGVTFINRSFENFHPRTRYDLIVGGPPFGNRDWVSDPKHKDLSLFLIHDFFIAKAMRLLKEEGILAMIMPSSFLDNITSTRKAIQDEGGYLISSFRLADDIYMDTTVAVDIIFLGKKPTKHQWLISNKVILNDTPQMINEYYISNPQHIMSDHKQISFPGLSF